MLISNHDIWILLIAALTAVSCALLGVFLTLRRMAMLGDAISHSVLLSLALGFLITGTRDLWIMWPSAILIGLLTAFLVQFLGQRGQVSEDSAIGIGFTSFFALGVILISSFAGQVDLDQECILYGEIALAPFDTITFAGQEIGPRAFWNLLGVLSLVLMFSIGGFRQMRCICFDPLLAQAIGLRLTWWHYGFMALVSVLVVSAFESVGTILVIGMLVIPANFAYLISKSLRIMLFLAPIFSITACLLGYLVARAWDLSISASIVSVMGCLFVITWLLVLLLRKCSKESSLIGNS